MGILSGLLGRCVIQCAGSFQYSLSLPHFYWSSKNVSFLDGDLGEKYYIIRPLNGSSVARFFPRSSSNRAELGKNICKPNPNTSGCALRNLEVHDDDFLCNDGF